jgi:hypothetical protein
MSQIFPAWLPPASKDVEISTCGSYHKNVEMSTFLSAACGLHFQKHREQERQGDPLSLHHRDIPQKSNPPHALAYGGLLAVRKIPVGGHPF